MKRIVLLLVVFTLSVIVLSGANLRTYGPCYEWLTTDDFGVVSDLITGNDAGNPTYHWLDYMTAFCEVNGGAPLQVKNGTPNLALWDGLPVDPGADGNGFFIPNRFEDWSFDAGSEDVWHTIYEYHDAANGIDMAGATGYKLVDPHPTLGDDYSAFQTCFQFTNIGNAAISIIPFIYMQVDPSCNISIYSNHGGAVVDYDGIDGTSDDFVAAINQVQLPDKPFYLGFGYPMTHYRLQTYIATPNGLYDDIFNGGNGYDLTNLTNQVNAKSEMAGQYPEFTLQPNQAIIYWHNPKPIKFVNSAANHPTDVDYERKFVNDDDLNALLTFTDTDVAIKYTVLDYIGTEDRLEVIAVEIVGGMIETPVNVPLANVSSIRYWEIFYDTRRDANTTCNITFAYDPATDGITNENTLLLAYRTDYDQNWTQWANITRDPDNNAIRADGVNMGDAHWILASTGDNPLPVALSSFEAVFENNAPLLKWTTQSETDNLGWNLYRSLDENGFAIENYLKLNSDLITGMGTCTQPTDYSFVDENVVIEGLTYYYWLESVSVTGELKQHGPVSLQIPIQGEIPGSSTTTALDPNYPNPFNPSTTIKFSIEEGESGRLTIYNLKGQALLSQEFASGEHSLEWNAEGLSSGIYFCRLQTSSVDSSRKMILMK